jgi:hypothetical protein
MNTNKRTAGILEDVKINVKIKLSALWVTLMFCYTYADILGFYAPGNIEELISGGIAGIQMTQGLLLGSAVLMAIPSVMVFLSLTLKAKANRMANIIVGIVYLGVLGGTFLTGRNPPYYICYATLKAVLIALIVWYAWKWPKQVRIPTKSSRSSGHAVHLSERSDASTRIIPLSGRHGQRRIGLAPRFSH